MKRFFDTELFKKGWFMDLSPAEKTAWMYITANCDNVGVWDTNRKLADFTIGETVDWDSLPGKCNGNIEVLDSGKWWLVDFCRFQHADLDENSKSPAVRSYVQLLKKHGLWQRYVKGIDRVPVPYKEREQVWEKERVRVKEEEQERWVETDLEKSVLVTFQKTTPMFRDNAGNLSAVPQLVELARSRGDPEKVLPAMVELYRRLRSGEVHGMTDRDKKFWRSQPFTPKGMLQLWERLEPQAQGVMKDHEKKQRVTDWLEEDVSFG